MFRVSGSLAQSLMQLVNAAPRMMQQHSDLVFFIETENYYSVQLADKEDSKALSFRLWVFLLFSRNYFYILKRDESYTTIS